MDHSLKFQRKTDYPDATIGITVSIDIRHGSEQVSLDAKVDTGAECCLFQRSYGEILGLSIAEGERIELATVNSRLVAFGHDIVMNVVGIEYQLTAYFYEDEHLTRTVLGRRGWLQQTRVGIIDYDRTLFLSHYDS